MCRLGASCVRDFDSLGDGAFCSPPQREHTRSALEQLDPAWGNAAIALLITEVSAPVPAAVVPPVAAAPAVAPPPPKPVARFRHDFIQTPTHVTVTFYMKGATDDNCQVDFEERALTLDWTISSSDSWQVTFDPLFDAIVPAECTKTCMKVCLGQRLQSCIVLPCWLAPLRMQDFDHVSCRGSATY